jgi:hypothetical protein
LCDVSYPQWSKTWICFNDIVLEHAIKKVEENHVGIKLNGSHQLLVYAGNVNLSADSIHGSEKITEAVIEASMGVAIEINTEKAKYHHQNAGQNHNIKTANR